MSARLILTDFLLDEDDAFRLSLVPFAEELNEFIASIPTEHRENALIELEYERGSSGDYGEPSSVRFMVYWWREESDKEFTARRAKEEQEEADEQARFAKAEAKALIRREKEERETYERLKAKFG